MGDLWQELELRTRGWDALARQSLADAVWQDHVDARFVGTGDARALPLLFPYLRGGDRATRLRAITTAGRVFQGAGTAALTHLDWFTRHPDPFLRDRAVVVVAAALEGAAPATVTGVLRPWLDHANRFVRRSALDGLAQACAGSGDAMVLGELERGAATLGEPLSRSAVARVFAGRPDAAIWARVADEVDAVAILARGAGEAWFLRARDEVLAPRLTADVLPGEAAWWIGFRQRFALLALARVGRGYGMAALRPALALASAPIAGHALLSAAQPMFAGADEAVERPPLLALLRDGDAGRQRVAALALGRLLMGDADAEVLAALADGCRSRSGAVRAAMLLGLGLAARSSRDGELLALARAHLGHPETAVAALRAIGLLALGTADPAATALVRGELARWRTAPRPGPAHLRPLAACHWALGLIHLGTGDPSPLDDLLPTLALPDTLANREYRRAAAKALALIEHSEARLSLAADAEAELGHGHGIEGPWTGIVNCLGA